MELDWHYRHVPTAKTPTFLLQRGIRTSTVFPLENLDTSVRSLKCFFFLKWLLFNFNWIEERLNLKLFLMLTPQSQCWQFYRLNFKAKNHTFSQGHERTGIKNTASSEEGKGQQQLCIAVSAWGYGALAGMTSVSDLHHRGVSAGDLPPGTKPCSGTRLKGDLDLYLCWPHETNLAGVTNVSHPVSRKSEGTVQ